MSLTLATPVGSIRITASQTELTAIDWGSGASEPTALLVEAAAQITAYFEGTRQSFDLPLAMPAQGGFQQRFLQALIDIPFGQTVTYGDLAATLGAPAQAIGQACGGNPLPIVIPCHRVLGASGLGGYSGAGGIETKVALLRHEGAAGLLI